MSVIDDLKKAIEREIHSYERSRNQALAEATKQKVMLDCYNDFVYTLKDLLKAIEQGENDVQDK